MKESIRPSVFIRKGQGTGNVILSTRLDSWDGFLSALSATDVPVDFLVDQDRQQCKQTRDPLQGWAE